MAARAEGGLRWMFTTHARQNAAFDAGVSLRFSPSLFV